MNTLNIRNIWICLALAALVLGVFHQVPGHDFVSFDDGIYVLQNPHIQQGLTWEGITWAFTTTYANFWHPLTWLSHMLDWHVFGPNPAGHHGMNLFLHAVNAILLFLVLQRMTGAPGKSAMVAALFAIHPLHVESVAWASERKDVLSTLFWILTMGAYHAYVKRPHIRTYFLVFFSFLLGLMAKPMLVTLPFVLLLLDYWPLKRFGHTEKGDTDRRHKHLTTLLLEKVPLLLCAALASVAAFVAQDTGGAIKSDLFSWDVRVLNALVAYASYVMKTLWPQGLAVFYPHPGNTIAFIHGCLAGLFLLGVTGFAVFKIRAYPYIAVGWFWFLGTLVPVIGLYRSAIMGWPTDTPMFLSSAFLWPCPGLPPDAWKESPAVHGCRSLQHSL